MYAKAQLHFKKVDPILYKASLRIEPIVLGNSDDYFYSLTREITGQQLSGKVAAVIFDRFRALFPDQKPLPQLLLNIPEQSLRDVGMAWSKVRSLKDLATKIVNKELVLEELDTLPQEEIQAQLTQVKGIGPWTAEMFLMFALGKEDVFSFGDLGLQNAIKKLYDLEGKPTSVLLEELTAKWSPYRTYAALILWDSLDNRPT